MANSLNEVLNTCPYDGGYDLKIGTSDKGDVIDNVVRRIPKQYSHLLVVFGGLRGIEAAHESDESLSHVEDTKNTTRSYRVQHLICLSKTGDMIMTLPYVL